MSVEAMAWALGQKAGSPTGKGILLVLAFYADGQGELSIRVNDVARDACCHITCASRGIANLGHRGFLTKKRVGGGKIVAPD